ncbi:ArsR/SmtB family transcription factor [Streptomyces sp. NPDC057702]|uniref:ArsR/SmtB family transcription factor n=1 Tax=unclassified Streptomyces TaxID=2593676 RepID=UPI0036B90457
MGRHERWLVVKSPARLKLGELRQINVRVSTHPGLSVRSLFSDVLGGPPQGVPPRLRQTIRAALPPGAARLLRSLFASSPAPMPSQLTTALDPFAEGGVEAQLERIRDLSSDAVQHQVVRHFAGQPPAVWDRLFQHPRVFSAASASVQEAIWRTYEPMWRRAAGVRAREVERVGTALVTNQLDLVLSDLGPGCQLVDSTLHFADPTRVHGGPPARVPQAAGSGLLVLAPLFSGTQALAGCSAGGDSLWVGYPPAGLAQALESASGPEADSDALVLVLGEQRAAILRHGRRGATMTELANHLGCSPATATYHCAQLERAGLVQRVRQGRTVRLRLAARGAALLDLLR